MTSVSLRTRGRSMQSLRLLFCLAVVLWPQLGMARPECGRSQIRALLAALERVPKLNFVQGGLAERICRVTESQELNAILQECALPSKVAGLYLEAGRCWQLGGFLPEVAKAFYERYRRNETSDGYADPDVRAQGERTDLAASWIREIEKAGNPKPGDPTALLVLRSNLSGVLVSHIPGYPSGLVIDRGETRIRLPADSAESLLLEFTAQGFTTQFETVKLLPRTESIATVDFRSGLGPQSVGKLSASLSIRALGLTEGLDKEPGLYLSNYWEDYSWRRLTPHSYVRSKPLIRFALLLLDLAVIGGGSTLVGTCAANVRDMCQSNGTRAFVNFVGMTAGTLGLIDLVMNLMPPQRLPVPGLDAGGSPALRQP